MTVRRGIGQGFGFGIGCLALVVAIGVAVLAMGSAAQKNAQIGAGIAQQAPVVVAPTAAPHAPAVLLSRPGTGIQRTERFTAPGDWTIAYTYDCLKFGFAGNFIVTVYAADGSIIDLAANALGKEGKGTQPEYQAGTFYLEVNSECDWTIEVKG